MITTEQAKDTKIIPHAVYGGKVHSFKMGDALPYAFDGEILQAAYFKPSEFLFTKYLAVFACEATADMHAKVFEGCERVNFKGTRNAYDVSK